MTTYTDIVLHDTSNNYFIPYALIDRLGDVSISNPTQGQNLTYDTTTGKWKNTSTSATVAWGGVTGNLSDQADLTNALNGKQESLVSGTSIKTINNTSLLGSGNIDTSEIILIRESEATQYTYQEIHDLVWTSDKLAYYYKESSNLFFPFIGFDSNNSIIFGLPDIYISTTDHNGFKYVYIDTNSAWHIGFDDIEVKISGKVSKSGDTMTGGLLIQKDDSYFLRCQRTDAIKGTTPSSSKYWGLHFLDGEGGDAANRLGSVEARYTDTGGTRIDLACYKPTSGSTTNERISLGYNGSNFFTLAPKPIASSDTNNIATTNWVNDKLYYRVGDKITSLSGYAVCGYLTSSKQRLHIIVPLPKLLDKVNGINITAMTISARQGSGGYVPSDGWNAKTKSTITTSFNDNMLHIECYSTSAFTSFTNNINVVVAFGTFTATFT